MSNTTLKPRKVADFTKISAVLASTLLGGLFLSITGTANAADGPRGGYGGQSIIACNSNDYDYRFCAVNGVIDRAWIANQRSLAECTLGYTWGYSRNGVWTRNGCRAEIAYITGGRGGSTGYDSPRGYEYSGNNGQGYGRGSYESDRGYDRGRDRDRGRDYDRGRDRYYGNDRRVAIRRCTAEATDYLHRRGYRKVDFRDVRQVLDRRDHTFVQVIMTADKDYHYRGSRSLDSRDRDYDRSYGYDRRRGNEDKVRFDCRVYPRYVKLVDVDW